MDVITDAMTRARRVLTPCDKAVIRKNPPTRRFDAASVHSSSSERTTIAQSHVGLAVYCRPCANSRTSMPWRGPGTIERLDKRLEKSTMLDILLWIFRNGGAG